MEKILLQFQAVTTVSMWGLHTLVGCKRTSKYLTMTVQGRAILKGMLFNWVMFLLVDELIEHILLVLKVSPRYYNRNTKLS